MKKSNRLFFILTMLAVWVAVPAFAGDSQGTVTLQIPTPGLVTMVDLGANKCIPCKMMAPIIEKLKKQYNGKASIVFIDVWEHHDQVEKYGIRAIPTQIFFDKNGTEVYRNVGFMAEEAIVQQLEKMGIGEDKKNTGHGAQ
jgi:thioredoxin 1